MECLFCKIIKGEIPCQKVYEDAQIFAFRDINPVSPHHILLIPKKHIPTVLDLVKEDDQIIGYLIRTAGELAEKDNFGTSGARLVLNCNRGAGQSVFHLHLHLLGGRTFNWPPG